ncbi:MAG: flagellar motor protein MotB [Planctomycetota bacterium]
MADLPEEDGAPETPEWIVTFTDLMSLLLTFFILLLTFSTPKVEKLFELRGSIRDTFGIFSGRRDDKDSLTPPRMIRQGREQRNPYAPSLPPRFRPLEDRDPNEILLRLRDRSGEPIAWERIREGYRVFIRDAVDFAPGEEDMSSASFGRLATVARALEYMPYHLVVVGYTGSKELPLLREQQTDPMDLAIRRAVRIAQRLVRGGDMSADRIAVAGYGPERSQTSNGRAEFIIVDRDGFAGR